MDCLDRKKSALFFEDTEKSLVQLQALCQKTLFDSSRCWGFSDFSTILEFISSLSIALLSFFLLFDVVCLLHFLVFTIMNTLYLLSSVLQFV